MTYEIGVAEKESSTNLPFVEIGRRGNVRADCDLNERRIYDLSELFCAPQVRAKRGAEIRILQTSTGYYTLENMSDGKENADTRHSCEEEQQLEKEIHKEIHKLEYFLDETDELIKLRDYTEMDIANRRAEKIVGKLSDLISQAEELKIDHGVSP